MTRRAATGLGAALCVVALVALGGAGATNAGPVAAPPTAPSVAAMLQAWDAVAADRATLQDLRTIALSLAAHSGDPEPSSARFYETTRHKVDHVFQEGDYGADRPTYVIAVQGDFIYTGSLPAGATAERGRFMAIYWDRGNDHATDGVFGPRVIDLSSLGSGVNLLD